jgi:HEAT repeat protein
LVEEAGAVSEAPLQKAPPTKEPLPQTVDDSMLYDALLDITDEAASVRAIAARDLAQFKTQTSVAALTRAVLDDAEESVRLESVKSLKAIAHDTTFIPLFISLSDESPQVRAAAAEALKGWPSERAGNYFQLIESSDERLIERAAQACIKTSLFKQALSHLNSQNQKHSNEAFAMLSILARAGFNEPLLRSLEEHYDSKARLLLIRLLNESGRPASQEQLRALASREDLPEDVRAEIAQAIES